MLVVTIQSVTAIRGSRSKWYACAHAAIRQDRWSSDVQKVPQGMGSGFFWDDKGHVVTNFHGACPLLHPRVAFAMLSNYKQYDGRLTQLASLFSCITHVHHNEHRLHHVAISGIRCPAQQVCTR